MTIEEIRKLLAAITPGPWYWDSGTIQKRGGFVVEGDEYTPGMIDVRDEDAEFIAKAPEVVAFLLGEIERLRAAWDREYGDPYGDPLCSVCREYFDNYRCACDSVDLNTKAPVSGSGPETGGR